MDTGLSCGVSAARIASIAWRASVSPTDSVAIIRASSWPGRRRLQSCEEHVFLAAGCDLHSGIALAELGVAHAGRGNDVFLDVGSELAPHVRDDRHFALLALRGPGGETEALPGSVRQDAIG